MQTLYPHLFNRKALPVGWPPLLDEDEVVYFAQNAFYDWDFCFETTVDVAKSLMRDDIITVANGPAKRQARITGILGTHVFCLWFGRIAYDTTGEL